MIPAWVVSIFSFTTCVGLLRESSKKSTLYMKFRWLATSFPFFLGGCLYMLQDVMSFPLDLFSPLARSVWFSLVFLATCFFFVDLVDDITVLLQQRKLKKNDEH